MATTESTRPAGTSAEPRREIPVNRRSGGTPHDDATLILDRARTLLIAAEDILIQDKDSSLPITLLSMLLLELDDMGPAIDALAAVGAALGPAEHGGDRRSEQVTHEKLDIAKVDRHRFRQLAAHQHVTWFDALELVRGYRPNEASRFVHVASRADDLGYLVIVDSGIRADGEGNVYGIAKRGELFLVNVELAEVEAWVARREETVQRPPKSESSGGTP